MLATRVHNGEQQLLKISDPDQADGSRYRYFDLIRCVIACEARYGYLKSSLGKAECETYMRWREWYYEVW